MYPIGSTGLVYLPSVWHTFMVHEGNIPYMDPMGRCSLFHTSFTGKTWKLMPSSKRYQHGMAARWDACLLHLFVDSFNHILAMFFCCFSLRTPPFPTGPDPSSQPKWRTPREVQESKKVGITPPWQLRGDSSKTLLSSRKKKDIITIYSD